MHCLSVDPPPSSVLIGVTALLPPFRRPPRRRLLIVRRSLDGAVVAITRQVELFRLNTE